jgi:hypothetical protein
MVGSSNVSCPSAVAGRRWIDRKRPVHQRCPTSPPPGTMDRVGSMSPMVTNAGLMSFEVIEDLIGHDWMKVLNADMQARLVRHAEQPPIEPQISGWSRTRCSACCGAARRGRRLRSFTPPRIARTEPGGPVPRGGACGELTPGNDPRVPPDRPYGAQRGPSSGEE